LFFCPNSSQYFNIVKKRKIQLFNLDYKQFINTIDFQQDDFVYFDPPYLITFSEYNKLWNEKEEIKLLETLDDLHRRNIKFAISNVTNYKGKKNMLFLEWTKNYYVQNINSNYISYHDNSIKSFREVLVTNYRPNIEKQQTLFESEKLIKLAEELY